MRFQTPLVPALLIRRYKRFLADVRLEDGREVVAHCANPGAMTHLAEPGARIWLEPNEDPRKKLRFGWRLVETAQGALVGIDTGAANRIVREALEQSRLGDLAEYSDIRAEQPYGAASRVDFLLRHPGRRDTYLEVKSVTLSRRPGLAEFPDCVTTRGARHMDDLAEVVRAGHRAVMLFLVQRDDCTGVSVAADIDPGYHSALNRARAAGVEVQCHACSLTPEAITLAKPVNFLATTAPLALSGKAN